MAVTFTVEDGTLVDGANALVSVTEADDVNSIDPASTWGTVAAETKKKLIMLASRWLSENVYWFGRVVDAEQPLCFPRVGLLDRNNNEYAADVIPKVVRELCARLAATFEKTHPENMEQAAGVRRFRTDMVEVEWQQGYLQARAPAYVSAALSGIGYGPGDHGPRKIKRF